MNLTQKASSAPHKTCIYLKLPSLFLQIRAQFLLRAY